MTVVGVLLLDLVEDGGGFLIQNRRRLLLEDNRRSAIQDGRRLLIQNRRRLLIQNRRGLLVQGGKFLAALSISYEVPVRNQRALQHGVVEIRSGVDRGHHGASAGR